MTGALAVFDLGKTNSKLFVFAPDGTVLDERRTKPVWVDYRGKSVLDDQHLFDWMSRELASVVDRHGVTGLTISGHGCTFALVRAASELLHPILDYEQEIPDDVAALIDPQLPSFSVLCYPQHWVWRFTGRQLAEYSYLGCHNQIWAPTKRDYSSLVDRLGWRSKFPPIAAAGEVVGSTDSRLPDGRTATIAMHNGVHDSNAALAYYRMTGLSNFTLVSTGTWVITINLDCPLSAFDCEREMLANVTVDGEPAPTVRFMGGREFDLISGWNRPISQAAVEAVMARGVFAMPSWAPGGPFSELQGHIVGGDVTGEARAALAALYVVLMTDLSLDLIQSANMLVVDGGLAKIELFTAMLAQLRPAQKIVHSKASEGSAMGAAALAFKSLGLSPFGDETRPVMPSRIQGLDANRAAWRDMANSARTAAREQAQGGNNAARGPQ
jgi:sugar (pentulose or hexulose) kinase